MAVPRSRVRKFSRILEIPRLTSCRRHVYVTLKVYTTSPRVNREITIYQHIQTVKASHDGKSRIRPLLDAFELKGKYGNANHQCLVHPPLGMSLWQLMRLFPGCTFTEELLKATLINLFVALDYLHTEANIIHTGMNGYFKLA